MSNSTTQAVTDIIRIGHNSAYQILYRTLRNGKQRYSFKHGLFWINPNGNIPTILPSCDLGNYDEQTKARLAAKRHLESVIVQNEPNQPPVQVQVVPHAPASQAALPQQPQHPVAQQPYQSQQQVAPAQVEWQQQATSQQPQQSQSLQPPKPFPSGGFE